MRHKLWTIFLRFLHNVRADAAANLGAMLAVGLAVSIPLMFGLMAINMGRLADSFAGQVEIMAYISVDAGEAQIQPTLAAIRQMSEVESAQVVTAEEALGRFREELPEAAELIRELDKNPLPPSIEIRLHARYRDLPAMEGFARQIGVLPGIVEVDYGKEWAQRLGQVIRYLWMFTFLIGLFLAGASGLLVANTIRLAIYRRHEEITIYRLVGASNSFIRIPLLLEGIFQGLLGSLIGFGLGDAAFYFLGRQYRVSSEISSWLLGGISPHWFSPSLLVAVLAIGGGIGFIAAVFSTSRHMRI